MKPKSLFMIPQSLQLILFCVPKMIFYQILVRIWRRMFLSKALCTSLMRRTSWLMLIFFCGKTFYPETPTKIRQINRERNYISISCEKTQGIPSNDQKNCFFMSSITLIHFWTHTTYGTKFQQLSCHPNKVTIGTLCPISTLSHQLTNLEQTHIRWSLHCEQWTVKWRDCASDLHSFWEITYRMNEWTKQLLRLKSSMISGNLEQWMELRRLWWTVIVFKKSYLFHLFDLYCFLVQYSFFLENLLFCSLSMMNLSET